MAEEILEHLYDRLKVGKVQIFFDLDSTLFNVSHRTQAILRDFANTPKMQELYPAECEKLKTIRVLDDDWGIRTVLERSQIQSELRFFESVREFWMNHFFSNRYLIHDQPYEGAVEFVRQLKSQGADIAYLTGRDRPRMETGTVESLRKWNFPLETPEQQLFMKPSAYMNDGEFKRDFMLQADKNSPSELWLFENEPVIIDLLIKNVPRLKIVFMDTVHSGRAEPPTGLPVIKTNFLSRS